MNPVWRLALIGAGFGLLAASLAAKKKAGWFAVAGLVILAGLAVRESDPVLALGAFALVAAGRLRPAPRDAPGHRPGPERGPRNRPGQRP